MPNNRDKGKVGERWLAGILRPLFPDVQRNAGTQAREGGADLINTGKFAFEMKYGKSYVSRMNRNLLDQAIKEAKEGEVPVVVVKPHREKPFVMMQLDDFIHLIKQHEGDI